MEKVLRDHLNAIAREYESLTGWGPAHLSFQGLKDHHFLTRINNGCGFTIKSYDRLEEFARRQWPDGYKFPELTLPKR